MTIGAHHLTRESIRASLAQLERFTSGSSESAVEFINLDWRTWCGVMHLMLTTLYANHEAAINEAHAEGRKDEAWDDEEAPDDEAQCPECEGHGGDKWNDYCLPCSMCGGDGRLW